MISQAVGLRARTSLVVSPCRDGAEVLASGHRAANTTVEFQNSSIRRNCAEMIHDYRDLIRLFDDLFAESENTILVAGDSEPLYLPADESSPKDRVIFANGFFASALHEVSHWCIAGSARRRLVDFGYWYQPDGRTVQQQRQFEAVEVKPQALEWIFSVAAGSRFNLSLDNLSGAQSGREEAFRRNVQRQAQSYIQGAMPRRARLFQQALVAHYRAGDDVRIDEFLLESGATSCSASFQPVNSGQGIC